MLCTKEQDMVVLPRLVDNFCRPGGMALDCGHNDVTGYEREVIVVICNNTDNCCYGLLALGSKLFLGFLDGKGVLELIPS